MKYNLFLFDGTEHGLFSTFTIDYFRAIFCFREAIAMLWEPRAYSRSTKPKTQVSPLLALSWGGAQLALISDLRSRKSNPTPTTDPTSDAAVLEILEESPLEDETNCKSHGVLSALALQTGSVTAKGCLGSRRAEPGGCFRIVNQSSADVYVAV